MKVLVSGSTGLVGSAVARALVAEKHLVGSFSRRGGGPGHVHWDPSHGLVDGAALDEFAPDVVIHLAGENIAAQRWTESQKRAIRESRVGGTALVAGALARMKHPPKLLVSASAVGYYGDRGGELLTEESEPGHGFLADTCRAWEGATAKASECGIRVVHLRIGMVLDAHGGALARMLPVFRLGLGGRLGSGRQYVSWIALSDLVSAVRHVVRDETISGPVNATSPRPVTNAELGRMLGHVLSRPAVLPVPEFALRLALGEMADALLLSGQRAVPRRLEAGGFTFRHPALESALRAALGR